MTNHARSGLPPGTEVPAPLLRRPLSVTRRPSRRPPPAARRPRAPPAARRPPCGRLHAAPHHITRVLAHAAERDGELPQRLVHWNRVAARVAETQRGKRALQRIGGGGVRGLERALGHVLHGEGTPTDL